MTGWQRRTRYEPRIHVYRDADGEHHTVYLWATERPRNRARGRRDSRVRTRPFRQPFSFGRSRKGRFA